MRRSDGEAGLDGEKNGMCRILCECLHGYIEKHSRCDVNCHKIRMKTIHSLTVNSSKHTVVLIIFATRPQQKPLVNRAFAVSELKP